MYSYVTQSDHLHHRQRWEKNNKCKLKQFLIGLFLFHCFTPHVKMKHINRQPSSTPCSGCCLLQAGYPGPGGSGASPRGAGGDAPSSTSDLLTRVRTMLSRPPPPYLSPVANRFSKRGPRSSRRMMDAMAIEERRCLLSVAAVMSSLTSWGDIVARSSRKTARGIAGVGLRSLS